MENLLIDRFKQRVRWEENEAPVYVLRRSKTGVKFKDSDPHAKPTRVGRAISQTARRRELTWIGATMEDLAGVIRNRDGLDRPRCDRTGLKGRHDIQIAYLAQNKIGSDPMGPEDIDIFAALPQQLGLVLVPQKATVKLLVVDHGEQA